jgi:peptide/nickel transport system permease protein
MLRYVMRRVGAAALMLVLLSAVTFGMLRSAPGDPIAAYVSPTIPMSAEAITALRHRLGLDLPLAEQFGVWAWAALRGDLGRSIGNDQMPVATLIAARLPPTLLLMGTGILISTGAGVLLGIVAAVKRGGSLDALLAGLGALALASPAFLTALLALFLFAARWHVLPAGGLVTPGEENGAGGGWVDVARHLVLPASVLAAAQVAMPLRYMRASMIECLGAQYVRTARAKGLSPARVVLMHALRNALLPVVTLTGATIGTAIGGAVFVESVFDWPGMGSLLVDAVTARDYPLVMGIALVVGAFVLAANLATDLVYAAVDPRIRIA